LNKQIEENWSSRQSEELYGFKRWGQNYFAVDEKGYVNVKPLGDGQEVRILDVIAEARQKGLSSPMVIRFQDIIRHRVVKINEVFAKAIEEEKYQGAYRGVFPIKVNQMREVIEEVLSAGKDYAYGLEAGSKPELMIALAMHDHEKKLIICNGYKDEDYIRVALLGKKLDKEIIIVVEQLSEIDNIIRVSKEMNVEPLIGLRVKLNTQGEGKWAKSSGDSAKFGLTTSEILTACRRLKENNLSQSLRLLHFHIGSQVPNIITIKNAVIEATRFYVQLVRQGFPMGYIDVGGGLGIDYDGSRSNFESSTNYSIDEYARDIVSNVRDICETTNTPAPDIISESGRAIVAPHSILVLEVFERISKRRSVLKPEHITSQHKVVTDLKDMLKDGSHYGPLERFHDALQKKEEAFSLFNHGYLDLESRAQAESLFWEICYQISENQPTGYQPEELIELNNLLADQYVCNFSVFQSLLDHWALKQLFPIAPLHRLAEKPSINSTLVDITCDSDGKIAKFIDLQDVKDTIQLHPLNGRPYYIGIFLTGAYQDIMGDLHNLFGRVNEAHVFLEEDEENGFYIEETISGNRISEVLKGVQYQPDELCRLMKKQIDEATRNDLVKPREGVRLLEFYEKLIQDKTYLSISHKKTRRQPSGTKPSRKKRKGKKETSKRKSKDTSPKKS
jgi:arginine decarboxylase